MGLDSLILPCLTSTNLPASLLLLLQPLTTSATLCWPGVAYWGGPQTQSWHHLNCDNQQSLAWTLIWDDGGRGERIDGPILEVIH